MAHPPKAVDIPNGTNVYFHGFLWSSPSTYRPICLRAGRRGYHKQIGRFPFVWLRGRRRPQDTGQKYGFCWRNTSKNYCAVWNVGVRPMNNWSFESSEALEKPRVASLFTRGKKRYPGFFRDIPFFGRGTSGGTWGKEPPSFSDQMTLKYAGRWIRASRNYIIPRFPSSLKKPLPMFFLWPAQFVTIDSFSHAYVRRKELK